MYFLLSLFPSIFSRDVFLLTHAAGRAGPHGPFDGASTNEKRINSASFAAAKAAIDCNPKSHGCCSKSGGACCVSSSTREEQLVRHLDISVRTISRLPPFLYDILSCLSTLIVASWYFLSSVLLSPMRMFVSLLLFRISSSHSHLLGFPCSLCLSFSLFSSHSTTSPFVAATVPLSLPLSLYIYIYVCISLSLSLSLSLYIYMYLALSVSLYIYVSRSLYLSLCLSLSIYIYLALSVSLCLSSLPPFLSHVSVVVFCGFKVFLISIESSFVRLWSGGELLHVIGTLETFLADGAAEGGLLVLFIL